MVFESAIPTLWSNQNKSVRLFKSVIDSVNLSSLNKIQIRMCHDYNNDWNEIKTNPDKKIATQDKIWHLTIQFKIDTKNFD